MQWLEIRNTRVSVLEVLESISAGCSAKDILLRYPNLVSDDIAHCAEVAKHVIVYHWAVCSAPQAALDQNTVVFQIEPPSASWSSEQETELTMLVASGASAERAARILMKSKQDITQCLKRLKAIQFNRKGGQP